MFQRLAQKARLQSHPISIPFSSLTHLEIVYAAPRRFAFVYTLHTLLIFSSLVPLLRYVWPGRIALDPPAVGGALFALVLAAHSCGRSASQKPRGGRVVSQRIGEQLSALDLRHTGKLVTITASIGIACMEQFPLLTKLTAEALLGAADRALYSAKRTGRDRFCSAVMPVDLGDQ